MKKIFFASLLLAAGFVAKAQEGNGYFDGTRSFYGGLILGMNMSQVDGDTYGGYHRVGLNAGGVVYVNFGLEWGASLELLFSQKGARGVRTSSASIGSYYEKYTMVLNYAEVPLLFHFYRTPKIHIDAGASYSQFISGKETVEGLYGPTYFTDADFKYQSFEVDGIVGASYMLYAGLKVDFRFQYSLTPIRITDDGNAPQGLVNRSRQLNNMFALRLAYLF